MAGVVGALLRAGLAVKLGHLRQATAAYMSDRLDHGRATLSGYIVGAAFYAAAGVFLIAALLVGAAALFRWVETNYGLNAAFGATAGALVLLGAVCAIVAASSMRPRTSDYPGLGSRLHAALHAAPPKNSQKSDIRTATAIAATAAPTRQPDRNRDRVAAARETAASVLRAPAAPRSVSSAAAAPIARSAGAAAAVGLLGWALARRYRRPDVPAQAQRNRR